MSVSAEEPPFSSLWANGQVKGKPKRRPTPGVIEHIPLQTPLDVAIARTTTRKLADELGYSMIDQVRLATITFEIADQIVTYAGQGEIIISWRENTGRHGLQFSCHDQGRHAPQLTTLWQTGETDSNILNIKRQVDEFKFTQDPHHGNCISLTVWLE